MNKSLPLGVKIARILNIIQVTISIISIVLIALTALGNISKGSMPPSDIATRLITICIIHLVIILIAVWLIVNLGKLNPAARRIQIIFSILGLFSFPIGTILHAIILYSMFRRDTKEAFGIIKS